MKQCSLRCRQFKPLVGLFCDISGCRATCRTCQHHKAVRVSQNSVFILLGTVRNFRRPMAL